MDTKRVLDQHMNHGFGPEVPMQHVNQIRRGQQEKGPNPLNMNKSLEYEKCREIGKQQDPLNIECVYG